MNAARPLVAFSDDVVGEPRAPIDVIFPVLHSLFGEDGSVQGLAHWSTRTGVRGCDDNREQDTHRWTGHHHGG